MLENKNWLLEDEDFDDWYEKYGLDEETFEDDGWIDLRGCDLSLCLDADDYESYMYEHGFDGIYYDADEDEYDYDWDDDWDDEDEDWLE